MKDVLVIEDDVSLAQLFATIIRLGGFNVDIALTGDEAVARLQQYMPDAIVLDMHLPGISGDAIYQMLDEQQQSFRVLICSADVQLVEEYKSRGVHAITKPIESMDGFTAMIARIADQAVPV